MIGQVVPVGLLTSYIRELFEGDDLLADVWVEGEVSNLYRAQSGHAYFTLKDSESVLKCALFRGQAARQRYPLRPGEQIAAHGRITVYERDGAYQLYVDVVQPAGLGLLALQLERLRLQLEAEGLFDEARKRPLPPAPRVIGVVTSPDGAVWHDIQTVLRRRYPLTEVILAPTAVQGERAPEAIVAALAALQLDGQAEVIILARGGGSTEDLWAFNDERVARAVFACRVPVVSGVGHETDWTIVDAVADLRAPTPSAAAELCVPSILDLSERIALLRARVLRDGADDVRTKSSALDRLSERLGRLDPRRQTADRRRTLGELVRRAGQSQTNQTASAATRVAANRDLLRALDPRAVLGRGYAALSTPPMESPVWGADQVSLGQELNVHLMNGTVRARVSRVTPSAPERLGAGA